MSEMTYWSARAWEKLGRHREARRLCRRLLAHLVERGHVQLHKVLVSLRPDWVEVLKLSHFVHGHPPVSQGRDVELRPARVVATQQAAHRMLSKEGLIIYDEVA